MALQTPAIFGLPGGVEWVVIGVFGLLLFGRRLPEIARSIGKSIVEFKRGMRDVKNELDVANTSEPRILPSSGKPSKLEARPDSAAEPPHAPVEETTKKPPD